MLLRGNSSILRERRANTVHASWQGLYVRVPADSAFEVRHAGLESQFTRPEFCNLLCRNPVPKCYEIVLNLGPQTLGHADSKI